MSAIDRNRIAINTLMLYLRMGVVLLISLYTSRVVLDVLGETDLGIYNAVGGLVAMATFIGGTLSSACQRFFLIEMGEGRQIGLRNSFCMFLQMFAALAILVIAVGEPAGLWFLNNKMLLAGRSDAANWVFHLSIVSFVFVVIRLPYQGMVVAREKMKAFAYIGVFEAVGALAIALMLGRSSADHLVVYAVLMLGIQVVVTLLYMAYCLMYFNECRYKFHWDAGYFKEIFSFSGWWMIGTASSVFKVHGLNVLLNMFFGPAVNAARGMAFKVYGAIVQLQENFMLASKPQIIKSYSDGEYGEMTRLVWQASKFSAYLMLLVSVPVVLEVDFLLGIWLKEVPQYTAIFAVLMLVGALIDYIDYPVQSAISASGNIKWFQIVVGSIQMLGLPISYFLLKFGPHQPQSVFYIAIAMSCLALTAKLYFGWKLVGIDPWRFALKAILPVLFVMVLSVAAGYVVKATMDQGWLRLVLVTVACTMSLVISVLSFGMTSKERGTVLKRIRQLVF